MGQGDGPRPFRFDDATWLRKVRDALAAPGVEMLGEYRVLETSAHGGQGRIFKAVQPRTGRLVAIKRLGIGRFATDRERARFQREVELAASLDHPCIISVLGVLEDDDALVMEWVDGRTIDAWADSRRAAEPGPGTVPRLAEVLRQVAEAMAHAHGRGVLHRDLKPANIIVRDAPASGETAERPCILDFGLAAGEGLQHGGPTLTVAGSFAGTPGYCAPEQIERGLHVADARSDVFSLGCVMFRCLTGREAFPGETLAAVFDQIRAGRVLRPGQLNSGIDRSLEAIVLKALASEPRARYSTMNALADDLASWAENRPIAARPPTALQSARLFVRRHRAPVVLAGLAALTLVVALVVVATLALRLGERSRELTRTLDQRDKALIAERLATEEARRESARAVDEMRRSLGTVAMFQLILAEVGGGGEEVRERLLNAIVRRSQALQDPELQIVPLVRSASHTRLAHLALSIGANDVAAAEARIVLELAAGHGLADDAGAAHDVLGRLAMMRQAWPEAVEQFASAHQAGLRLARLRGMPEGVLDHLDLRLAEALARADRPAEAEAHLAALRLPEGVAGGWMSGLVADLCDQQGLKRPSWLAQQPQRQLP